MIESAKVVVPVNDWDMIWERYRVLLSGTLETTIGSPLLETVMREFERLKAECEGASTYWQWQRDRLDTIYKRRKKAKLAQRG